MLAARALHTFTGGVMSTSGFSEKQLIELATAEGFLALYNVKRGSTYVVERVAGDGETPDVLAKDASGNMLGIEVTLTEDRQRDIAAALGHSTHKSLNALRDHLQRVKVGTEKLQMNSLQENVLAVLTDRISAKLNKRYGNNVALVIRETSIPWDWEQVLPQLHAFLSARTVPFDRGIWLLSRDKNTLTSVYHEGT